MSDTITAVVGFSRCGTSLMMRMLDAGGLPGVGNRTSFEDDRAILLPRDWEWLKECQGKAVKILEPHIFVPPDLLGMHYNFIWMRRTPKQQALSQLKFLRHVGGWSVDESDWRTMAQGIRKDTIRVIPMLERYHGSRLIVVDFEDLIDRPMETAKKVVGFLNLPLNIEAMTQQVQRRKTDCLPGFLEVQYL